MTQVSFNKRHQGFSLIVSIVFAGSIFFVTNVYAWDNTLDWLADSIDESRAHNVPALPAWHARVMVLAWAILLPLGVLIARYFKVWPGQNWPHELDRREWWRAHLYLQCSGAAFAIAGVLLMIIWGDAHESTDSYWHRLFGWTAMWCLVIQIIGGLIRGSTGGPTYPAPNGSIRGDHYDMTARRKVFEYIHKSIGYLALLSASAAIIAGLWMLNAPRWMWLSIQTWWLALIIASIVFERAGRAVETYQAIWGPDPQHPGNQSQLHKINSGKRNS